MRMTEGEELFDPEDVPRAVSAVGMKRITSGFEQPPHRHRKAQLIMALTGLITCDVAKGLWMVPGQCALWIPGGLEHSVRVIGNYLPGKMVSVINYGPGKHTRALFIFASPTLEYDRRNTQQQKRLIEQAFADDEGWEIRKLLKALPDADDLYFDDVTQIHMSSWSAGRVALLGDAACAPTLITGQGSSVAVVGAYVLAGELKAAGGDHELGFRKYEEAMRSYVGRNQHLATGCPELSFPKTAEELEQRNMLMRACQNAPEEPAADDSAAVMMQAAANAIQLKDYNTA